MIKVCVLFLTVLFVSSSYSQFSGNLISSETEGGISYANIWVSNKGIGTTSTFEGKFRFDNATLNDTLIISALGFEKKIHPITKLSDTITLIPIAVSLKEITVSTPKTEKELEVGKFKKSFIHSFMGSSTPAMYARKFDYDSIYRLTPFLKEVEVLTKNKLESTKINLRILSVTEDGSPGKSLIDSNLIVKVKHGKKNTKIDLSKLLLRMPENGLYIAFEWLILEENKFHYTLTDFDTKIKTERFLYQPSIGLIESDDTNRLLSYVNGDWHEVYSSEEKPVVPAITLTLSN